MTRPLTKEGEHDTAVDRSGVGVCLGNLWGTVSDTGRRIGSAGARLFSTGNVRGPRGSGILSRAAVAVGILDDVVRYLPQGASGDEPDGSRISKQRHRGGGDPPGRSRGRPRLHAVET